MALHQVEGIILRVRAFGEADKILVVYTRQLGKIDVIAKGARRFKSRLAGATQQFNCAQFSLFRGKSVLFQLSEAELQKSFTHIHGNLERLAYASYLCELTENLVPPEEQQPEIFYDLLQALEMVNVWDQHQFIMIYYQLKLMTTLGYQPVLEQCLHCGQEQIDRQMFFSPPAGGIVCERCTSLVGVEIRPLSKGSLAILRRLQSLDWDRLRVLKISPQHIKELSTHLSAYVDQRLEKKLKTLGFLKQLGDQKFS